MLSIIISAFLFLACEEKSDTAADTAAETTEETTEEAAE